MQIMQVSILLRKALRFESFGGLNLQFVFNKIQGLCFADNLLFCNLLLLLLLILFINLCQVHGLFVKVKIGPLFYTRFDIGFEIGLGTELLMNIFASD